MRRARRAGPASPRTCRAEPAPGVTTTRRGRWVGMTRKHYRRRQRDVGGALLVGAVVLAVVLGMVVLGVGNGLR